jgi:hypothetical protein
MDLVNSVHLSYLRPLLKWRIMDVKSLMKESELEPNYHGFYRIIRELESKKVLEGFRDPYSRKKYVYLSSRGESALSLKENPTSVSENSLIHDLKVSEICRLFLQNGWIKEALLEHEINDKRAFLSTSKVNPDALFEGERKGKKFKIAFELELTRKSKQRIIQKALHYGESDYYDYVLYMFSQKSLVESYMESIKEKVGTEKMKKFMFFFDPFLTSEKSFEFDPKGYFQGRETSLGAIFSAAQTGAN